MSNNNNQQNHGFFNPRFIQDIFRTIGPHFNGQDEDEDIDMPALEPIDNNLAPRLTPVDPPVSSSHLAEGAFQPSSSAGVNHSTHDNDSDTMPDLQSVSDSSESESEGDADEVEMMPDLQPVDDDDDSAWTDDDNNNPDDDDEMPALEPVGSRPQGFRSSNRRARVDDDDDEDRDRRHPSQRTNNDEPNNINTNNQHQQPAPQPPPARQPHAQHQHPINIPGFVHIVSRGPFPGTNPDGIQLFQRLFGGAMREPNPNLLQPGNPPVNVNVPPTFTGGFTITLGAGPFRVETGEPRPQNHAHAHAQHVHANAPPGQPNAPHPHPQAHPHPHPHPPVPMFANMPGIPGTGNRAEEMIDAARFAELMARFGVGLEQALGIAREEREDPDRAKRLVDGLEEVPFGLVRRLESVGGAPGGHVDSSVSAGASEDTGSVPGCAICWDRLLDAEGDGFAMKEIEKVDAQVENNTNDQTPAEPLPALPTSTPTSTPTEPKIVSLPCSHVFHASCLLPWFSRPMQTTCPTCRFNVDPENLTFVRRPRPPRRRASSVREDGNANMHGAGTGVNENADAGEGNAELNPTPEMHVHIVELNGPGGPPAPQPFLTPLAQPTPAPTTPNVGGLPPNANPANPNGGFWTFGIDMVFEDERPENEDDDDDGSDVPDMRQAEDFAQDFMRQEFATANALPNLTGVAPAPAADHPATGTDNPGAQQLGIQFAQFIGMNGNGAFVAGNAGPGQEPQPQSLEEFMQMFQGAMGGAGVNRPAGTAPAQAAGGNMPTGDAQAAFIAQLIAGALPVAGTPNGPHIHHAHGPPPTQGRPQKKPWSPPQAPGPTLRQRVEQREREAGLRCFDMSCGMGPSDEEPFVTMSDAGMKQLLIRPLKNDLSVGMGTSVCSHTFHPSCLVSAVRVSLRDAEEEVFGAGVAVSCPSCRAAGCISKGEWEEGVAALV